MSKAQRVTFFLLALYIVAFLPAEMPARAVGLEAGMEINPDGTVFVLWQYAANGCVDIYYCPGRDVPWCDALLTGKLGYSGAYLHESPDGQWATYRLWDGVTSVTHSFYLPEPSSYRVVD